MCRRNNLTFSLVRDTVIPRITPWHTYRNENGKAHKKYNLSTPNLNSCWCSICTLLLRKSLWNLQAVLKLSREDMQICVLYENSWWQSGIVVYVTENAMNKEQDLQKRKEGRKRRKQKRKRRGGRKNLEGENISFLI